jgi:aromatic ring-opening dioxygenase catalytic subunit (LigB family)
MAEPRMPTLYLPHGGGPCFYMPWTMGPPDTWERMAAWLRALPQGLPRAPTALLVVSAHWEEARPTVTTAVQPPLLFDYYGFPPHTYELTWPAPGSPALAERVQALLGAAGIEAAADAERGYDHGVFVPLKLSFPQANVPTVALSLRRGLDPAEHLALGRALVPLRDEGVLVVGSGMSYHNMRRFMSPAAADPSRRFDDWLTETVALPEATRSARLEQWALAPAARECHPREEHLLPLMVVAGAAGADAGARVFRDEVMGATVSAVRFG